MKREHLVTYIDAAFDLTGAKTNYVKLGKDLTDLTMNMNPSVETTNNIWGESNSRVYGYNVTADTNPYFVSHDESLSAKLMEIVDNELTGDDCLTTVVDVWLKRGATVDDPPTVVKAIRREVLVAVQSYGGDNKGVNIPFSIHGSKNKVKGTFDIESNTFTAN